MKHLILASLWFVCSLAIAQPAGNPKGLLDKCKQLPKEFAEVQPKLRDSSNNCVQAIQRANEKCGKAPDDSKIKLSSPQELEGLGASDIATRQAAALRTGRDQFAEQAKGCDKERELVNAACAGDNANLEQARESNRESAAMARSRNQSTADFDDAERKLRLNMDANRDAVKEANEALLVSRYCNEGVATLLESDAVKSEQVAATAASDAEKNRLEGVAKRTTSALLSGEALKQAKPFLGEAAAGVGAAARFAGVNTAFGVAACASGDSVGCTIGAAQAGIDVAVARGAIAPYVGAVANPAVAVGVIAGSAILSPTPTAGPCLADNLGPIGRYYNSCGWQPYSVQSLNSAITILQGK